MINVTERPTNFGEIAFVKDTKTGDYSLSLDGAIAALTAENERLHITIDDLLNKIEYLRCLRALGAA